MKFMNLLLTTVLLACCVPAYAGFDGRNGSTDLGIFNKLKCSTGMSCSKVADQFVLTSSPSLTSALVLTGASSTSAILQMNANAAAANADKWQFAADTSTDSMILSNKTSGSYVAKVTVTTGGAMTVAGALAPAGGISNYDSSAVKTNWSGWLPKVAVTEATSATPSATVLDLTQVELPYNMTITGINVLNAATCGTNKWIVAIFDDTGAPLANSALAGTLCSGASGYQQIAFTAPVALKGPGTYWLGLYADGATDRYYSVPAFGKPAGLAGTVTGQTFGTVVSVTLPTTFTADKGPVAYTY